MSNIFGGKGKALYVPMSEIEQEFISRLVESNELHVLIHDWGHEITLSFLSEIRISMWLSRCSLTAPTFLWLFTSLILSLRLVQESASFVRR